MRRPAVIAVLVALSLGAACSDASESSPEDWATEADDLIAQLADAYDIADAYQTARFFTAGGSLDLAVWGEEVATTPDEVVEVVADRWFMEPEFATVSAEHLFVAGDGAVVWWRAAANDFSGGSEWAQAYIFGTGGHTTSRAFRGLEPEHFAHELTPVDIAIIELADRYVAAWASHDAAALQLLYTPDAVVRDDVQGKEWLDRSELLADLAAAGNLQPVDPRHYFVYEVGDHVEAIVVVQTGGECPRLEARRWVLAGERIVREARFTHVPSARRCLTDLREGWWTTFELPPDLQNNVTEIIDVGGSLVDLINAEPNHEAFSRWMIAKYVEAGIGVPEVSAVWFPPSPDCIDRGGLAIETDERYEGRHTVVVCFADDRLEFDRSESGWHPTAIANGLHELAHIWMLDRLTDDRRAAFNALVGAESWRSASVPWRERGMEHAAFTISWGVTGVADARYPFAPRPSCEQLAERYELLTGHEPVTHCGAGGWTQQ
ncbi:MAG: hypothetical protein QNJ77_06140 [Acidimicrobiia bacterium]|nr:hypothetical protein [Acidimicrobiia bacterium]